MKRDYHCCATCQHFRVRKEAGQKTQYMCKRLGYATHPTYTFNCWAPNETVTRRLKNER